MKKFRLAASLLALAALMPNLTSCKSDKNPFDIEIPTQKNTATISIRLAVDETRAEEMSTTEENKIQKVTIHVFDANQKLETTKDVVITSENKTVNIEVSHGLKTIYVISPKSNFTPSVGTKIDEYESSTFSSKLENLMTSDGFLMVGKSNEQMVMLSASENEIPSSNQFDIKLTRLVAKAQVKTASIGNTFGINFGAASFKAIQTNERMRVVHNGSDVLDKYVDTNNNGTYDNYSLRDTESYKNAVTADFTADGCEYLSENIVSSPVSGNTTFLGIRFSTTPEKYYTFNESDASISELTEKPTENSTYYAVGIVDRSNGIVDYTLHSNNIITFKDSDAAAKYMNSLNNGSASAIRVFQTDSPIASATRADSPQFEVVTFDQGQVYYRVNIAHKEQEGDKTVEKFKVMRNKFYKVSINSVKNLGFSSESLLRPTNPTVELGAESHSFISASISIADWDVVEQNVNL